MEIPLHHLPKAGRRFVEQWSTIGVAEDSGLRGLRAVEADLVATGDTQRLHLAGQVSATVELICSRCLKEFEQPTRTALDLTYALTRETLEEDLDVERLVEGRALDPQPEIIGAILSELPFRTVCSEGCRGLCPQCGADLNLGPCGCTTDSGSPFAVLKNLKRPTTGGDE
ncbi:MAG: DUF177 domain-containing protein [Nitrospirota bacterium]|jgi:uncharacterized protein